MMSVGTLTIGPLSPTFATFVRHERERDAEPMCVHHCLANIISFGTVEELSKKLAEKPKQFLVVPQYDPIAARGKFVPSNKEAHKAAHIEVQGTGKAAYAVHRHDTKVGEIDENEAS